MEIKKKKKCSNVLKKINYLCKLKVIFRKLWLLVSPKICIHTQTGSVVFLMRKFILRDLATDLKTDFHDLFFKRALWRNGRIC